MKADARGSTAVILSQQNLQRIIEDCKNRLEFGFRGKLSSYIEKDPCLDQFHIYKLARESWEQSTRAMLKMAETALEDLRVAGIDRIERDEW